MNQNNKKEEKVINKQNKLNERELIIRILKARKELDESCKNFEYAEGDLIDYYAYQIKANCSMIDYLIKQAKNKGIVLDMVSELNIKLNMAI